VLVIIINLTRVSEKDRHVPPLGLELGKANQRKVKSQERSHFPNLEGVIRSDLAKEWNPARLAFPMEFHIEIRNEFKLLKNCLLAPLPSILFALV
jgi:hypothetical protein